MTTATAALRRPGPAGYEEINRYSRIIVDEALARGIGVEIVDPTLGELCLTFGGRSVTTLESLSELTSAVAFRRCDDKLLTRSVLHRAALPLPAGREATFDAGDVDFLAEHGSIVVKPARGEQGRGVTVGVTTEESLNAAVRAAQQRWPTVLLEERHFGDDVRAVVIDGDLVAAAVRRPAAVHGDGSSTVAELVEVAAARRLAETEGAGQIPLDEALTRMARAAGWELASVLPAGEVLVVGSTANVHCGATIADVTAGLHPALAEVAIASAAALELPVAGVDLIADAYDKPGGVVIEVNEQPGLANHEPQPTAARFVDLLFPETRS